MGDCERSVSRRIQHYNPSAGIGQGERLGKGAAWGDSAAWVSIISEAGHEGPLLPECGRSEECQKQERTKGVHQVSLEVSFS
jgi:hypothetical protein